MTKMLIVVPGFWIRNLEQPDRTAVRDAVKAHGMNEGASPLA